MQQRKLSAISNDQFLEKQNEGDKGMIPAIINHECIATEWNPVCTQSESDVSKQKEQERNMPLVYSEPALVDLELRAECRINKKTPCASLYRKLPCYLVNDSGIASLLDGTIPAVANIEPRKSGCVEVSSCFFEGSKQTIPSPTVISIEEVPKKSYSTCEIREQHAQAQKKYRYEKQRRHTDPVDFEGILKILGGCTWWHFWVYILVSVQRVPHAMFASSIVFLMYQPDHWCEVPGINDSNVRNSFYKWTLKDVMKTTVVFPLTEESSYSDGSMGHDQCRYYNRTFQRYEELHQMNLNQAIAAVKNEDTNTAFCQRWEYDKSVMRSSIVIDWNLVCSGHFKKAHAHLLCSLGFIFGCLLGGYVSDRFGRRITIIGFGILSAIFGFFLAYSTYFPIFLLLRFLNAACNEAAQLAAYVLCIEVTGVRYRGTFGILLQAPWALGHLLVTFVAYVSRSWRKVQLITASLHFLAVLLVCVLPESPRWLIVNNRVEEAERYIRQACRDPPLFFTMFNCSRAALPCDLELVKHTEQQDWVKQNRRANIFSILKSRVLCFRIFTLSSIWIATALIYFVLFDQLEFGKFTLNNNFFANHAVIAASEIPAMLGCIYLFRYGHKNSQVIALLGATAFLLASVGAARHNFHMIGLICLFFAKIFVQGSFNILYIFSLELYPTVIRNSAIGFNTMILHLCSGVSSYLAVSKNITTSMVLLTAVSILSIFAAVLGALLPDSLNKPLPDTLQDAVTFLQVDGRCECSSSVFWKQSDVDCKVESQEILEDAINDNLLREVETGLDGQLVLTRVFKQ